jgi:hypothetical protein
MSKPQENSPATVLVKTFVELQDLMRLYSAGLSIQHERPQRGGSGGGRQKGTHSDPTANQALMDDSSKSVRTAVLSVEQQIVGLHDQIAALRGQMERAIDRWDT